MITARSIRSNRRRQLTDLALALSLVGAVLDLAGASGGIAAGLVLAASVLGVGWGIAGWIDGTDTTYTLALALGSGVAVWIVIAITCVETGVWEPRSVVGGVLVAAYAVNAAMGWRQLRRARQS